MPSAPPDLALYRAKRFRSDTASEQRFALLGSRELIIGNKGGIQDVTPIDAEQRYGRISFHGGRAVIWQTMPIGNFLCQERPKKGSASLSVSV